MAAPVVSKVTAWLLDAKKLLVYLLEVASQAIAMGLVHGQALAYLQIVLAVAGAVGLYGVRNGSKPVEAVAEPVPTPEVIVDKDVEAALAAANAIHPMVDVDVPAHV